MAADQVLRDGVKKCIPPPPAQLPSIGAVYPLEEIAAAHRSLEHSGGFGKRVIQVA